MYNSLNVQDGGGPASLGEETRCQFERLNLSTMQHPTSGFCDLVFMLDLTVNTLETLWVLWPNYCSTKLDITHTYQKVEIILWCLYQLAENTRQSFLRTKFLLCVEGIQLVCFSSSLVNLAASYLLSIEVSVPSSDWYWIHLETFNSIWVLS